MVKAFLSRSKSTVNHDSASDAPTARSQPRPSSSSTVFPSLLKLDTSSSSSKTPSSSSRPSSVPQSAVTSRGDRPAPLVSLKLTAPSFLDVVVRDRESKQPVYIIETVRDSTSIYRLNPEADEAIKVSTVQWPNSITRSKFKSGRSVLMANDRWREAEELLKLGPLGSVGTRKFNIPHYPHSFKWKLIPGGHFYCSTAGANGPFAILDSSVLSAPARLSIFHNCLEEDDTRTQESYRGIPVLLLDYLVTTCLLLVTDVQEWMDRQQTPSGTVRIPGSSIPAVKRWLAIIHNQPLPPSAPTHSESVSPAETTISSAPWGGSERRISTSSTSPPVSSSATTTPPTPSTPGTSLDYTMARPISEEIPPVPPLPTSPPEANIVLPYLYTHPSSSAPHLLQGLSTPSTSSSPGPSSSSIRAPRRLPKPPILPLSPPPPPPPDTSSWHTVNESLRTSEPGPSTSALIQRSPSPSGQSSSSGSLHSRSRSSRGSMGRLVSPPSLPPPSSNLPIPPKLAQELNNAIPPARPQRTSQTFVASPLGQSSTGSGLQAVNPDPLDPEDEARIRDATSQIFTSFSASSSRVPLPHMGSVIGSPPPASAMLSPSSFSGVHVDAGRVAMRDAVARQSYAESVYDPPPPAYDAIDFSLPRVRLQPNSHGQ